MSRNPPENPTVEDATGSAEDAERRAKVLVVDDYQDNAEMYAEYLDFAGFEVTTAADGVQALQSAEDSNPDVILMDLSLPLIDGWEAIRRLKANPKTQQIPVIALTGHAMATHEERARTAGCNEFVAKPCLPEDLEGKIRSLLTGSATKLKR